MPWSGGLRIHTEDDSDHDGNFVSTKKSKTIIKENSENETIL